MSVSRTASAAVRALASAVFQLRQFAINQAWLELVLTGVDLLAWTRHLLLDGPMNHCGTDERSATDCCTSP